MNKAKASFILLIVLLGLLWLFADRTTWSEWGKTQLLRDALLQLSGVLTMGVMSVAMILATRPLWLEAWLGGLDKMYRLHKWLGIAALVFSVFHWGIYSALTPDGNKTGAALDVLKAANWSALKANPGQFIMEQYDLASSIGGWMFKLFVVLCALALIRKFPYRLFFKPHILLVPTYLALVFHALILMDAPYWNKPLGWVMALLMAAGGVSALMLLFRRVVANRGTLGEVVSIDRHDALNTLAIRIQLKGNWAGHQAGQFAFVTLNKKEGPHPFTISSAWTGDGQIKFTIKALGDYTRTLADTVKLGDVVRVEGPYGGFTFQSETKRQIWIGAGIGITPFMARMKALARSPDGKSIDLFHTTTIHDANFVHALEEDALASKVRLHVLWNERDGFLDAVRIAKQVSEWRDADVWFCGPAEFGQALRTGLVTLGLSNARFHQELFELR